MRITNSENALVEHYVYATATGAALLWYKGGAANHNLKHVAFAAVFGVIGPVLAKLNTKGIVAKLTKQEHLSAPEAAVVANIVNSAVSDADKSLAKSAK